MKSDHYRQSRRRYSERAAFYSGEKSQTTLPLQIITSGSAYWDAGHTFLRNKSDLFGVELVCSGNVHFVQEKKEYLVNAKEIFLLRKGTTHRYTTGTAGFYTKRYITLDGMILEPILRASGLWQSDVIRPVNSRVIESLIKQAHQLLTKKPTDFAYTLSVVAYQIILELARNQLSSQPAAIMRAIEFMQQNLASPFSSTEISGWAGLSTTHFNRMFLKHMHKSPMQFFIDCRMDWARHLLTDTALSIKEIAVTVGYENPLYFSARFAHHTGMSPKFFRNKNRVGDREK